MTTFTVGGTAGNEAGWVDELLVESTAHMRSEIRRLVNCHCYQTGAKQQEVWRAIYASLGIPLPAKKRLDYIESEGKMGDLYKIALAL